MNEQCYGERNVAKVFSSHGYFIDETERRLILQKHEELEKRLSTNPNIDVKRKKPIFFLPCDLPDMLIDRPVAMENLRKALLGNQDKIVLKAVHGMGGLGKTVLARAICDDPVIREAFPDGIVWATTRINAHQ